MLFVILVLLIALGIASPYISVVMKRRKMLKRITAAAAENGCKIRTLHKFVCLSPNRGAQYDLIIGNKTRVYPIKLWSAVRRNSTLVIKKNGYVFETYGTASPLHTENAKKYTVKGRELAVRATRDNFKVRSDRTVTPILLYYPCNKLVLADLGNSKRKIEFGDTVFKKILCSPTMLEKMLASDKKELLEQSADDAMLTTREAK